MTPRIDGRRRSQTIIHVLLTFHLRVYYGVLRFVTVDLRTITTSHDSMRFKATRVYRERDKLTF